MKLPLIKRELVVSIIGWTGILLMVLIPIFLLANMNASDDVPDLVQEELTEEADESQSIEVTPEVEASEEPEIEEEPSSTPTPDETDEPDDEPTLLPPPTFEPATPTPTPSPEPIATEVPTLDLDVENLDINGLSSPTPEGEEVAICEPREDWGLTYQVQAFDTLSSIADLYSTNIFVLADGNCLDDPDVISIGQVLRVPGDAPPAQPEYECVPWEVLTPINNAFDIDGAGQLTFVWRGPRAPRNLVRVFDAAGNNVLEVNVDLAQNATINLMQDLPNEGVYTWYVYPLDWDFTQIDCVEGGPWIFHKNDGVN